MPQQSFGVGTVPLVLKVGERVTIITNTGCTGTIAVPGEGVAQTITAGTLYDFGGYTTQREVVLSISAGTVSVNFNTDGSQYWTQSQADSLQALVSRDGINGVALIGDSRIKNEYFDDPTFEYLPMQGICGVANALSGMKMNVVAYKGVGGNRTTDILARIDADLGSYSFDRLVFMCDINDVMDGGITTDQTIANYVQIYQWAHARMAKVDHICPYPPQTAITDAQLQALLRLRQWILSARQTYPWVYPVDAWSVLADATAIPPVTPSAYIVDPGVDYGKHINGAGALRVAPLLAANWAAVPASPLLVSAAADSWATDSTRPDVNVIGNPLMTGSSGQKWSGVTNALTWTSGVTYAAGALAINAGKAYLTRAGGTAGATGPTHTSGSASDGAVMWEYVGSGAVAGVATGYIAQRTTGSGTVYACTVDRADGIGKDQLLALTGGSASEIVAIWPDALESRAVNGAAYQVSAEIGILAATGLSAPSLSLRTTVAGSSKNYQTLSPPSGGQDSLWTDRTITLRTLPVTIPAGSVTSFKPQFEPRFINSGCRGLLRIGRWSCRRVA